MKDPRSTPRPAVRLLLLTAIVAAATASCRATPTYAPSPTMQMTCGWRVTTYRYTLDSRLVATDSARLCTPILVSVRN